MCHAGRPVEEDIAVQQRQLYLTDTYLDSVRTRVLRAGAGGEEHWVILSENIFHPQGGGQPRDRGTVDDVPAVPRRDPSDGLVVLDVAAIGREIRTGDEVTASIDIGLRRLHAALHTAGHVVDSLMRRLGYKYIANNHFPGQASVDYTLDTSVDKARLHEALTDGIAEAVMARLPVTAGERDGLRAVTIESLGTEPCGGTHVPHLGAIQGLRIRSIKTKGNRLRVGYDAAHLPVLPNRTAREAG